MAKPLLIGVGVWMGIWLVAAVLSRGAIFKNLAVFALVTAFASMTAFVAAFGTAFSDFWND